MIKTISIGINATGLVLGAYILGLDFKYAALFTLIYVAFALSRPWRTVK